MGSLWRTLRTPLLLVLVFLASTSSVMLAPEGSEVAAWWPAAGLATGTLLCSARQHWPVMVAGLAVVTGVANLIGGRDPLVAVLFGAINASEALVAALVLTADRARPRLDSILTLVRLLVAASLGAVLAGLGAGLVVQAVLEGPLLDTWRNVAASHGASQLLVLPLFMASVPRGTTAAADGRDRSSHPVLATGSVIATLVAFGVVFSHDGELPLAFLPLPTLVWAALVLGRQVVSALMLAIGVLCTLFTAQGLGPLAAAGGLDAPTVGALVQVYLVVIVFVTLPLALAVELRAAALHEAEAARDTYRRGMAESLVAMVLMRPQDDQLVVLEANAPASELLGSAARPGLVWSTTFTPALHARLRDDVRSMLAGGPSGVEHEWWMTHPAPRCVRLSLSWVPQTRTGDMLVAQFVDLTEARAAERRFRDLLDATTATAIIGTALDGTIRYFNVGAERLLGWAAAEAEGHWPSDLYEVEQQAAGNRTTSTQHTDRAWRRKDGTCLVVSAAVTEVRSANGDVDGHLCVAEDVTRRHETEQRLNASLALEHASVARLEELDRIKSEFVSAVSHELRTPLTTLIGFADLLSRGVTGDLNASQLDVVLRMQRNGRRLLMLIEDLLTLSHVESTPAREVSTFPAGAVVAGAVEQLEDLVRDRVLDVSVADGAPDARLVGDPGQLERVLVNLLSNAVKFTPDGGTIRVEGTTVDGHLSWTISDTGLGVPPAERDRLFDRFYRATTAVESEVPGTGLGLTIVDSIVEKHGGTVDLVDRPGPGTTFRVTLPLARDSEALRGEAGTSQAGLADGGREQLSQGVG